MKLKIFCKKYFLVLIEKAISAVEGFRSFLMKVKRSVSAEKILSYSLTPKVLSEEADLIRIKPYLDSLRNAIDSSNVKNIALMGRYGSGKSTVLMTFKSQNSHLKYLNVSLANFVSRSMPTSSVKGENNQFKLQGSAKSQEGDGIVNSEKNEVRNSPRSSDEAEKLIELSVLQQLIFQINDLKIPESRFKRIRHISTWNSVFTSLLFLLWCCAILDLVLFSDHSIFNVRNWKSSFPIDWLLITDVLIGVIGLFVFFKAMLRFLANSRILKVSIKGEIELGQSESDSIFNKHIEEIIYFFQQVNIDVVFFEDLDRFPDSQIFSKLREINTLINSAKIKGKSVTFVYSVSDSVFKDKSERVKFFDYIIPVTPYLSAKNASDVFVRMLEDAGMRDLITNDFLLDVFTFVSDIDMRLLQNTFNEFVINSKFLIEERYHENLFSILLYKNVYPDDFSDLMVGKGNLYRFFEKRSDFISKLSLIYITRIEELESLQDKVRAEHLNNLNELKSLYLFEIVKSCEGLRSFHFDDDECTVENAVEDKYFDRIVSDEPWRYTTSVGYRSIAKSVNFDQIQLRVSVSQTYQQRKEYYKESLAAYLIKLTRECKSLEYEIRELQSKSVADLIALGEFEDEFDVFEDQGLVRYLISNGKIDEHYHDYIFRVYEDNLPKSDFEFERHVKSSKNTEFHRVLVRPDVLLKRIPSDYFNRVSVLNFGLLKYLFENDSQYEIQLKNFFSMVSKFGDLQAKFISELVRSDFEFKAQFFARLAAGNPDVWWNFKSFIDDNEDLYAFIVCLFKYLHESDLENLSGTEELDKVLTSKRDFESFVDKVGDFSRILNYFSYKGLKIELMPSKDVSEHLFDFFFENDLYEINRGNIATILMALEAGVNSEALNKAPYTQILSTSVGKLKNYVEANFVSFVLNVLFGNEANWFYEEDQSVLCSMLNRPDIDFKLKTSILQKQAGTIFDLSKVEDETLWPMILRTYKLELTLSNILLYFNFTVSNPEQKEINEKLIIELIVRYKDLIGKTFIPEDEVISRSKELYPQFENFLLYNELIELDLYRSMTVFVNTPLEGVRCNQLSKEKLKVLIENAKIAIDAENYQSILDFDRELMLLFVRKAIEIDQFSEISDVIEGSEWLSILSAKSIKDELKKIAVPYVDDNLLRASGNLNSIVLNYLVLRGEDTLFYDRLRIFLSNGEFNMDKLKLLNLNLSNLSDQEVMVSLGLLSSDYSRIFESRKRPVFDNNELHKELFQKLYERDLISGYKLVDEQIRVSAKV